VEKLHGLKREVGGVLKSRAEDWQQISRKKAHALAADEAEVEGLYWAWRRRWLQRSALESRSASF